MREVHAEGQRERRNMRENKTKHRLTPTLRSDGKLSWCCPHCMSKSKKQGTLDEWLDEQGLELDEEQGRYVEVDA